MRMKRRARQWLAAAGMVLGVAAVFAALFLNGVVRLNTPSKARYPVWGVDVSEYQGDIDWGALEAQGVAFASVRATEGSGHTDATFAANWVGVSETGILAGAYHFFSFDSAGQTQADNFMAALPRGGPMLPPVVDVELYGTHKQHPPGAADVQRELDVLLNALEQHYGAKPILYATRKAYDLYLSGLYSEHPVWIREVLFRPALPDGRAWTFWQYSDRGRLKGYAGEERFIDLNVFAGSLEELEAMVTP